MSRSIVLGSVVGVLACVGLLTCPAVADGGGAAVTFVVSGSGNSLLISNAEGQPYHITHNQMGPVAAGVTSSASWMVALPGVVAGVPGTWLRTQLGADVFITSLDDEDQWHWL
jgi:hypothetical protein